MDWASNSLPAEMFQHQLVSSSELLCYTTRCLSGALLEILQSALMDHAGWENHTNHWDNIPLAWKEAYWITRGIMKAISIRKAWMHSINLDGLIECDLYLSTCIKNLFWKKRNTGFLFMASMQLIIHWFVFIISPSSGSLLQSVIVDRLGGWHQSVLKHTSW